MFFFTDGPDFASAFSFSDVESIENYFLSTVPMTCMPVVYEDNIDDMSVLHKTWLSHLASSNRGTTWSHHFASCLGAMPAGVGGRGGIYTN